MSTRYLPLVTLALVAAVTLPELWSSPEVSARGATQTRPNPDRPAWSLEELADGVYFAAGTGVMTTMSNSLVIVNDDHVMLVDTSVTPAAVRALVEQIRAELTDKPIAYVFNSHYHFDHAHGNQIFGDDVEIIGHEYVRMMHLSNVLEHRTNRSFSEGIPDQLEALRAQVAAAADTEARTQAETTLAIREAHWNALQEVEVTPPNVTYTDVMTIHKGGREVQVHFLGRGHTGGDTMVFLPEERIIFTGDFFEGTPDGGVLAYMGDGFTDEWPASLERLKGLDFDLIVPGHGTPFRDRSQIDTFQAYLRDFWTQVSDLRAAGLTAEEATMKMDLSEYADFYGARAERTDPRAVLRAYELLQIQMPL